MSAEPSLPPTPLTTLQAMREFGIEPFDRQPKAAPAPVFPLQVLPPAMGAYVAAAARSLDAPAEMVGVPQMGLVGSLIGNRAHLRLKASWHEYPTLYLAIVAPPGTAKTPALNHARWPLDAIQTEARDAYQKERAAYEDDLNAWKAIDADTRGAKPEPPRMRHVFSTDLTVEALVSMLAHEPGLAIIRDEIGGWVAALDQYRNGKGSDRQQFLSLWSSQPIKADRKVGESSYVPIPVACVVGGIQPDLAVDLHHAAKKRDGFVERILPVVPDVGVAAWTDDAPTPGQFEDVLALFKAVDSTLADMPDKIGVTLSPEALAIFKDWHEENAAAVEAASGLAAGFYSKLPAHVARVALILHVLWNPDDPRLLLSAERMRDAIALGEFFRAHIARFLVFLSATVPTPDQRLEARILRILGITGIGNLPKENPWVSQSVIHDRLGNVTAEDRNAALASLEVQGKVEQRTTPTATKPLIEWRRLDLRERFPDSQYIPPREDSHFSIGVPNSHYSQFPAETAGNRESWEPPPRSLGGVSEPVSSTSSVFDRLRVPDRDPAVEAAYIASLSPDGLAAYRVAYPNESGLRDFDGTPKRGSEFR